MDLSLCVLTRNRVHLLDRLLESVQAFRDVKLELVLGDNSSEPAARDYYRAAADVYVEVTDEHLWYDGFGPHRQRLIRSASNDWVMLGDLGERWHENLSSELEGCGVVRSIDLYGDECPCFRGFYGEPALVDGVLEGVVPPAVLTGDQSRVIDKRRMKMLGVIHESVFGKKRNHIWSHWARRYPPVLFVEHPHDTDGDYEKRKRALYDHLVAMIVKHPELRPGTDPFWFTKYWEEDLSKRHTELSFAEWQAMGG